MITFTTKFNGDNIDKIKGVIKNVSLISLGVVQSHDCVADAKTLASVLACAKAAKKVRCKLDHGNSARQIIGSLSKFCLSDDGQKVLGDLQLLKSSPSFHYVLELAETLASGISLSIAFTPEFEKGANGSRLVRCTELFSVDVVLDGAANSGLFDASPVVGGPLANTSTAIPTGVKPKTRTINVVCPNCEAHMETFSKLARLHSSAADKLSEYVDSLESKDNVSSIPTEEFERRLEVQKLQLEKEFEKKASITACRMLAATGVNLSRIPSADVTNTDGGNGILAQLDRLEDSTEKGRFYRRHEQEIKMAFQRVADNNLNAKNRLTAGIA